MKHRRVSKTLPLRDEADHIPRQNPRIPSDELNIHGALQHDVECVHVLVLSQNSFACVVESSPSLAQDPVELTVRHGDTSRRVEVAHGLSKVFSCLLKLSVPAKVTGQREQLDHRFLALLVPRGFQKRRRSKTLLWSEARGKGCAKVSPRPQGAPRAHAPPHVISPGQPHEGAVFVSQALR